jgi:hypothetical protein
MDGVKLHVRVCVEMELSYWLVITVNLDTYLVVIISAIGGKICMCQL